MIVRIVAWVAVVAAGLVAAETAQAQRPGPGPGSGPGIVECVSRGYGYQRCEVPWNGEARLVQQLSDTRCIRGQNWDMDRRRGFVWVDRGCAARFAAVAEPWRPAPDWDRRFVMNCGSPQHRYAYCSVDVGGHGRVRVVRQTSDSACIEGRTWGWNRGGVWVDRGCSADFEIDRRW